MIVPKQIEAYIETHSSAVDSALNKIERDTYLNTVQPHMVSGGYQGKFLELIAKIIQPKTILEIGTFTGYSAIALAKGLDEEGAVHTIDVDEELMRNTQKTITDFGYENKIKLYVGDALEIIPQIDAIFDLVFIDADKLNYSNYFDLVVDKVRPLGVILVDNVLWKGKVLDSKMDKKTRAIHVFNQKIQNDPRVENLLLPIRDGIMWIVKK